jgi:hypothetical protein
MILAPVNEAQIAGARLHAACEVIGVSARTVQRWKGHRTPATVGVGRATGRATG